MNAKEPDFFDQPSNIKWMLRIFYGFCVILVITNLLIHGHSQHDWEQLPAFYALFGLVVCIVLAMLAKLLRKLIMRNDDYYDA